SISVGSQMRRHRAHAWTNAEDVAVVLNYRTLKCLTSDFRSLISALMLDVKQNRRARKYSSGEMTRRVLWTLVQPLFRFSPRPCFGWRRFLLRCFGAKIGRSVHVYPSATIYFPWNLEVGDESAIAEHTFIYNLGRVTLGARVTISHRAHLCAGTHDHTKADFRCCGRRLQSDPRRGFARTRSLGQA